LGFPLNDVQTAFTTTCSSYTSVFIHIYLYISMYKHVSFVLV
jgi:hypothetical protein